MKKLLSPLLAIVLLLTMCSSAAAASGGSSISDGLVAYIKQEEGFNARPYHDSTGWYIGFGCACTPGEWPDGITETEAETLLRSCLEAFAKDVNVFLNRYGISVTQGQFDAMVAMSFNFGSGWLDPANRLPAYLINGIGNYTDQQIASAFGAWCHVGGQISEPLLRRRIKELKMFLYSDYSFTADGWSWLRIDANGGETVSDVAVYRNGAPYGVLPAAERDGWYFAGWREERGALLKVTDLVTEPVAVTAVWSLTPPAAEPETDPEADVDGISAIRAFPDVEAVAWYAGYVEFLAEQGVLGGYEDGTFRPSNAVTWGEALKLILRAAGFQAQLAAPGEHWATGYLDFAEEKEYISGDAETEPDLNTAITRDEIADLCAAALELPREEDGIALSVASEIALLSAGTEDEASVPAPPEAGEESPFADSDRESVLALYGAGIIKGSLEDGRRLYKGDKAISRAELCAILTRMLDYVSENFVFVSGERAAIDFSLRMLRWDPDAFRVAENGRIYYDDPDQPTRQGIDVSYYQGDIDWDRVAADGIDFAIIRCGYRGYGKRGTLNEDVKFREYMDGALAAGLDVGVYFFSQAVTVEEALAEAEYTLRLIEGYPITYPVVFDWEQMPYADSRTARPDWDMVADCTDAFCTAVAAAGYQTLAYYNKTMSYLRLDMSRIQAYDGWLAWYHNEMDYIYDFQMWQYSCTGRVDGIVGNVDMNISFVDYARN